MDILDRGHVAARYRRDRLPSRGLAFIGIACLTVIVPVLASVANPDRVGDVLGRARSWLMTNNDVIMSVLFLVIGSMLIGDGLGQL